VLTRAAVASASNLIAYRQPRSLLLPPRSARQPAALRHPASRSHRGIRSRTSSWLRSSPARVLSRRPVQAGRWRNARMARRRPADNSVSGSAASTFGRHILVEEGMPRRTMCWRRSQAAVAPRIGQRDPGARQPAHRSAPGARAPPPCKARRPCRAGAGTHNRNCPHASPSTRSPPASWRCASQTADRSTARSSRARWRRWIRKRPSPAWW